MRLFAYAAAITGCLTVAGCIPAPQDYPWVPAVEGLLLDDGKPVAGAEIRMVNLRKHTDQKFETAVTDAEGRFSTKAITKFEFWRSIGDRAPQGYFLEVNYAGKRYAVAGGGYGTSLLQVTCDLSLQPQKYLGGKVAGARHLACQWHNDPFERDVWRGSL